MNHHYKGESKVFKLKSLLKSIILRREKKDESDFQTVKKIKQPKTTKRDNGKIRDKINKGGDDRNFNQRNEKDQRILSSIQKVESRTKNFVPINLDI